VPTEDWLERVAAIRQWSRGGIRAPHKPLLILYAIGRLQRFGTSAVTFREAEEPLRRLLLAYGPPGTGSTPQFPFRRLENDGLWYVDAGAGPDPGERLSDLRRTARGAFSADFEAALTDPSLRASIVGFLLEEHFPPSLHDNLLADAGIEPGDLGAASREGGDAEKRRRDPQFRNHVLVAYEWRCAFCGYDGRLDTVAIGLDAAHVRWHALGGPDTVDNGIGLCTMHHKLLDQGAVGITLDHHVAVSQHFVGQGGAVETNVLALAGRPLLGPQRGQPPVAEEHIDWHLTQVFRGPARAA
jgi:putative restriction endonuclease